ncbi:hypothetical protein EDD85DRAFT_743925, partial [Armillaria nabsnona]
LPELCIKAAKPRGLAREVWFYSRLETLQGNAIPRCFGFFTVPIADCIPGTGRWPMVTIGCPGSDVYNYCFDPDDGGYKASSPWDKWKYAPDQPLVAVLAVEKLGEPYYQNCPGDDPPHERYVESNRFIVCSDIILGKTCVRPRFNNVLRAVNQGLFCPRHKCYHRWRLIDFD